MRIKLLTLVVFCFVMLSNKGGRNAPASGAPIDGGIYCNQCHSGGTFSPEVSVNLIDVDGNITNSYAPNTQYTIQILGTEADNKPKSYGFQLVMLDTLTNAQAGSFDSLGTNVRKATFKERDYLMQSTPRADGVFTAKWTSPDKSTGGIKAYVAILGINDNGNTNGDKSAINTFEFNENIISKSDDLSLLSFNFYPNPAQGYLIVDGPKQITILDHNGRIINTFDTNSNIKIADLNSGVYFIQCKGYKTQKFIKI